MSVNIARFKNRSTEEFDIEVVTPMFLGGANTDDAELRVPSIKGMLRFWWRAICGFSNIQDMKSEEAKIFGSTDGKASFSIMITDSSKIKYQSNMNEKGEKFKVHGNFISIVDYLAYGTHNYIKKKGNVYHKKHIKPGSSFSLKFVFYDNKFKNDILKAFYFLVACGGLGARNRNGFGSIHWQTLNIKTKSPLELNKFSSFSKQTKLFTFSEKNRWVDALSEIGMAYRKAKLCVEESHAYEKRKLIVAPITVNRSNRADLERHAKPYFLHVNKLNNGNYKGQILFMPYKYLDGHQDFSGNKLNQYLQTCQQMNQKIAQLSRGNQ